MYKSLKWNWLASVELELVWQQTETAPITNKGKGVISLMVGEDKILSQLFIWYLKVLID